MRKVLIGGLALLFVFARSPQERTATDPATIKTEPAYDVARLDLYLR